jgi:glyoxylase-like metal-dependent hydrolase (beta-lactamase superfamily II)
MEVITRTVGLFAENTYFVVDGSTRESWVIDPGDEEDELLRVIREGGLQVRSILCTHGHLDHVGAVEALRKATGAPCYIHDKDRFLLEEMPMHARMFGVEAPPIPEIEGSLAEGQVLCLGGGSLSATVIETPGHSPGGVCLQMGDDIFVGDTLFQGSIGRADLPGGDMDTLLQSIRNRLFTLSESTRVHPGHGPVTTIGHEKRTNPFLLAY